MKPVSTFQKKRQSLAITLFIKLECTLLVLWPFLRWMLSKCTFLSVFLRLQSGLSLRRHASKLIDERLPKSWLARAYVSYVTRAGCLATMTCFALRRLIYDYFIFVYSIMLCLWDSFFFTRINFIFLSALFFWDLKWFYLLHILFLLCISMLGPASK